MVLFKKVMVLIAFICVIQVNAAYAFKNAVYDFNESNDTNPYNSRISGNATSFGGGWVTVEPFPQQLNMYENILGKVPVKRVNSTDKSVKYSLFTQSSSYTHLYMDNYPASTPSPQPTSDVGPYKTPAPVPTPYPAYGTPMTDSYFKISVYIPNITTTDIKIRYETIYNSPVGQSGTTTASIVDYLKFTKTGKIMFNNTEVVSSFETEQWYTVTAVYKSDIGRFDFYINNDKIQSNYAPSGSTGELRRFLQGVNFTDAPENGYAFLVFDDMEYINETFNPNINSANTDISSESFLVQNPVYKTGLGVVGNAVIRNIPSDITAGELKKGLQSGANGEIRIVKINNEKHPYYPFKTVELSENDVVDINTKVASVSSGGNIKLYSLEFAKPQIGFNLTSTEYSVDNDERIIYNIPQRTSVKEFNQYLNLQGTVCSYSGVEIGSYVEDYGIYKILIEGDKYIWYQTRLIGTSSGIFPSMSDINIVSKSVMVLDDINKKIIKYPHTVGQLKNEILRPIGSVIKLLKSDSATAGDDEVLSDNMIFKAISADGKNEATYELENVKHGINFYLQSTGKRIESLDLPITEDESVKAVFLSDIPQNATMLIILYDDTMIKRIYRKPYLTGYDNFVLMPVHDINGADNPYIKAFLWNDVIGMTPVGELSNLLPISTFVK